MGMSIDKVIEHGKEQLEIFGGEHKEFIETSIDTMRKYQTIEQIYSDYLKYMNPDNLADRIGEILENGDDDYR